MIVRFFKTGLSNGEVPIKYLLRQHDHLGVLRPDSPEIIEGSPALTIQLINGISRRYKYASGCLAFRPEEQPNKTELQRIIDQFKAVVAPGLEPDQFNCLFVLHREAPDKKTGLSGLHVHFVLPMTILAGKTLSGKNFTGRRWNPHPPGKRTIETMALFNAITNHEHGWAQVSENPLRVGVDSYWLKAGNGIKSAEVLRKEMNKLVRDGQINSRDELCQYLDQSLGMTITRKGNDYISVKFPNASRAIRLRGAMFESQADYADLRAAAKSTAPATLSTPEYHQAKSRLFDLLRERSDELLGSTKFKNPITTTTKENIYGSAAIKTRFRRNNGSSTQHRRGNALHVPASGMERNMFPAGSEQWRHSHGGFSQESFGGSQKVDQPSQYAFHANSSNAEPRGRRGIGWYPPKNHGQTINEQIRELGMQLMEFEPWSPEATAIMAQINALVGQREQLPKGPKFKK